MEKDGVKRINILPLLLSLLEYPNESPSLLKYKRFTNSQTIYRTPGGRTTHDPQGPVSWIEGRVESR